MTNMSDKPLALAHIVNPVKVGTQSDLYVAQPITFESMRIAKDSARTLCEIELYSAQFEEDRAIVPDFLSLTPNLEQSMMDFGQFRTIRKLPLIRDILDRLYSASSAEYLIYTNVDIALKPDFYLSVSKIIDDGVDGMVINRRTISDKYKSVTELPQMYEEVGEPHYGYDCFIFRRDVYPKFDLGNMCIGAMAIGAALMMNIACFSMNFREFLDLHLTFHLGNAEVWRQPQVSDYQTFNQQEYIAVLNRLAPRFDVNRLPVVSRPFLQQYLQRVKHTLLDRSNMSEGPKNAQGT